ncbi:MAG: type IV pilus assembly protein PilM, partial [Cyanobacteria bacterium REEB65]|nr:type IV pilus assembly protein PilM [Cyanobacteria bacterium REEB65]
MPSLLDTVRPYVEAIRRTFRGGSRIGLDITSDTIVAVELKGNRSAPQLANIAIANTPLNAVQDGEIVDPSAVAEVVADLLSENGIHAKGAICAVAGQSTIVRPVRFPLMPEGELAEVISYEAERYIPFALEDVNISHQVVSEVEEDGALKLEVVLVAAQKNLVNSFVKTIGEAGLTLDVVDVASFAVSRALLDT